MGDKLTRRELLQRLGLAAAAGSILGGLDAAAQSITDGSPTEFGHGRAQDRAPYLQIALEAAGWESVRYGYTDEGWKDTVLLMPGEKIRFLVRFGQYTGLFLYHCHNLEHEDMGMMRNYLVY